jgi:hypothetical protein
VYANDLLFVNNNTTQHVVWAGIGFDLPSQSGWRSSAKTGIAGANTFKNMIFSQIRAWISRMLQESFLTIEASSRWEEYVRHSGWADHDCGFPKGRDISESFR